MIRGVSTDTRDLRPGSVFVALRGTRHDGHAFAAEAAARGAAALMVECRVATELPQLLVTDTVTGLGAVARAWRGRYCLQAIAVVGSNGKTTVKDMPATILRRAFGCGYGSDVRATWHAKGAGGSLEIVSPWGKFVAAIPLLGQHNGRNALAAASAALALGVSPRVIAHALARLKAPTGRMRLRRGVSALRIIDDSYNANPSSFAAAFEVLAATEGEKVLVMGDMAELGDAAASWHTWVGEKARQGGIDGLYAVGRLSRLAVQAFGARARHFRNQRLLIAALQQSLRPGCTVLVKGSRCMEMDEIVRALLPRRMRGHQSTNTVKPRHEELIRE